MSVEQLQNTNTSNTEKTSFEKMATEVGEFDPARQKISSMYNTWKSGLERKTNSPIDKDALANTRIEESNADWDREIVNPYIPGIYASAPEIGNLIERYEQGDQGSIKDAVKLFSGIFGLKQELQTYAIDNKEYPNAIGKYDVYENVSLPPKYTFGINYEAINEIKKEKGANKAATALIASVAHEVWHAHQDEIMRSNGENALRQEKYIQNLLNYKDPETGKLSYHNQLVEDEAGTIENTVKATFDLYQHYEEAFNKNADFCAEKKAEILQLIRKQEERLAKEGI